MSLRYIYKAAYDALSVIWPMLFRMSSQKTRQKPTCVSLFAGAGGLDLGLEQAGFESVFVNELEETFHRTLLVNKALGSYSKNDAMQFLEKELNLRCWKNLSQVEIKELKARVLSSDREPYLSNAYLHQGDVRNLKGSFILERTGLKIGELDLLAGGPPCQPFSRAGKRETVGIADGRLFLEMTRLTKELKPRFVMFENVKGLAQSKTDVENYSCKKCQHLGVLPLLMRNNEEEKSCICGSNEIKTWITQNRGGSLEMIVEEFLRIGYSVKWKLLNAVNFGAPQLRERIILIASRDNEEYDFPEATHGKNPEQVLELFNPNDLKPWISMASALKGEKNWKKLTKNSVLWVKNVVRPHDEPVTWDINRPSPTIGAHQAAKLAIAPNGVPEEQLARQQWHVLGKRQGDSPSVAVEHSMLTDVELQILQTFPRYWLVVGTRMERAFQIGNAVPVALAQAIGIQLLRIIGNKGSKIANSAS
jgi:DNA (cytosine-5)-methyltransferase 1